MLRQAALEDRDFAEALYLENMKPLLQALGEWDEAALRRNFRGNYRRKNAQVILDGGNRIGWLQVSEQPGALVLNQIHLVPAARNRGIGTRLLHDLMARARREGRRVTLSVVRNNPARALYERLSFRVVGRDGYKLRMAWAPEGAALSRSILDPAP